MLASIKKLVKECKQCICEFKYILEYHWFFLNSYCILSKIGGWGLRQTSQITVLAKIFLGATIPIICIQTSLKINCQ